jgi:hypothetical protein
MSRSTIYASLLVTLILFWAGVQSPSGVSSAAPNGNALLISDIHFDPLADPVIVK